MHRTFAEETLARAITVLGDVHAVDDDREDAALVIGTIVGRASVCSSEADMADLLTALGRALHVHLAIRHVLGEVRRLQQPQVVERAGCGVVHLMAQAHQTGDYESLSELVLVALEESRWLPRIRNEWGKAAVTWAVNQLPSRYPLLLLVSGWLHAFGAVPDWMREIAEAHPALVMSTVLPPATRWRLHAAWPSVAGWRSLADLRGTKPAVEPALFGDTADVAMQTLQQAIGETTDEGKRTVLRLWLRELTGTTL